MVTTTLHWWCHSSRPVTGCWQTVLHRGDCLDTGTGNTPGTPCHGKHRPHVAPASPPVPDNNVGMTAVWRVVCCRCHARCVRLCPECRLRSDSRAEYRLVWTEESDSATLLRPTQTAVTDTDLQYLLEKQILKTTFLPTDWWIAL